MQYTLTVNDEGEGHVSFVSEDGSLVQVPHTHPNFPRITTALVHGDDPTDFLDAARALRRIEDTRVVVEPSGQVLFDGEPINNAVTRAILRYRNEGRDVTNLVRFLERLQRNPSYHARDDLFRWVERAGLVVGEDGRIIAHKGVNVVWDEDGDDKATLTLQDVLEDQTNWAGDLLEAAGYNTDIPDTVLLSSVTAGTASVNGIPFVGTQIPQWVGAIVSMDRAEVDDNSGQACSAGLHIGTFTYARDFATRVIEVAVAPEDVVSVPWSETTKLRCSRYEVLALQPEPEPDLSRWEPEQTIDEEEGLEEALDELDLPVPFRARLWDRLRGRR